MTQQTMMWGGNAAFIESLYEAPEPAELEGAIVSVSD